MSVLLFSNKKKHVMITACLNNCKIKSKKITSQKNALASKIYSNIQMHSVLYTVETNLSLIINMKLYPFWKF